MSMSLRCDRIDFTFVPCMEVMAGVENLHFS